MLPPVGLLAHGDDEVRQLLRREVGQPDFSPVRTALFRGQGARFQGSRLRGSRLRGARLRGARLQGAGGLRRPGVRGSFFDGFLCHVSSHQPVVFSAAPGRVCLSPRQNHDAVAGAPVPRHSGNGAKGGWKRSTWVISWSMAAMAPMISWHWP
ncbi:MAG: pentapeptide repeat-containing protein [Deltaproteobacteria bacterium]|nr:pentapeptide repeat-containing protein [Deltaproteobacteria bacterium]